MDARNDEIKRKEINQKTINTLAQGLYMLRDIATAELKKRDSQLVDTQEKVEKLEKSFTNSQKELRKTKVKSSFLQAGCKTVQNERDTAEANFLAEQAAHTNTQTQLASTKQQVNTEKDRADVANNIITNAQSTLSIADLNNLPTMPSGKSLADLITFFNTSTPTCSHPDYDTIKTERDTYFQQRDNYKNR